MIIFLICILCLMIRRPPVVTRPDTLLPYTTLFRSIILILADDLGYNDISLNGGGVAGVVKTPNIDALAREGVNFTTAYAAHATCSPSRPAMMTGRYPTRFGFEYPAGPVAFGENLAHGGGVGRTEERRVGKEGVR